MMRSTFVLVLLSSIALGAVQAAAAAPAKQPSTREADAIVDTMPIQGTDEDAIIRPVVLDGGEDMARYEAPMPKGGVELAPGDEVAPPDERPGLKVVACADGAVPGGIEPGLYDGTKDTASTLWRLQTFLAEGGQKYRFIGDRVFKAEVKVVKHLQTRWVWGRQELDDIMHTRKFRRVEVTTELKNLRVGAEVVRRSAGNRMGYEQVVCPVYQSFRVPVYRWVPVLVRTTQRQASLSWIKRYRESLGTFTVWTCVGGLEEWTEKNPTLLAQTAAARAVTKRVLAERAALLQVVSRPPLESYLRTVKPVDDPLGEFVLDRKRTSVRPDVTEFVEDDVPDAELVSIAPVKTE